MTRPKKIGTMTLRLSSARKRVLRRQGEGEGRDDVLDVALDEHEAEAENGDGLEGEVLRRPEVREKDLRKENYQYSPLVAGSRGERRRRRGRRKSKKSAPLSSQKASKSTNSGYPHPASSAGDSSPSAGSVRPSPVAAGSPHTRSASRSHQRGGTSAPPLRVRGSGGRYRGRRVGAGRE